MLSKYNICETPTTIMVPILLENSITIIIVLFTIGSWVLCLRPFLERRRPHSSIPMIPNSHWLFGHLFWLIRPGYLEKQQDLIQHADKRGRCSIWMGLVPSFSLTTPEDAKQLLWKNHERRSVPVLKYHFERLVGPKNLLVMNGREWKYYQLTLKTALSRLDPLLLQSITKETTKTLTRNIKTKIQRAGDPFSIEIDSIQSIMKMITMDVFGRSAFSHDFGCCSTIDLCSFARSFEFMEEDIMDRCINYALLPQNILYWIPTNRNLKFNKERKLVRGLLREMLQKQRGSNSEESNDIVSKIIDAHTKVAAKGINSNSDFSALSDEDLIDILLSILLAGYETVSTALTYAIFLICRHPEWEKRCLEEINEVTKYNNHKSSSDSSPSSDGKKFELSICRGVMMEALRLYPVATGSSRTLKKDLLFADGVTIPKDCHVGVSFWLIHRDEDNFPKPLEFRPDRWIPTNSRNHDSAFAATENNSANGDIPPGNLDAFFAFSGGARPCPGQHFALQVATSAFAWLLKDLEFKVDRDFELEIEWKAIVQVPKGGIPARVSIRR